MSMTMYGRKQYRGDSLTPSKPYRDKYVDRSRLPRPGFCACGSCGAEKRFGDTCPSCGTAPVAHVAPAVRDGDRAGDRSDD